MSVFILSSPIRSGKTSRIQHGLISRFPSYGFLTPDLSGKRYLYDIERHTYHLFETEDTQAGIAVGRFLFDKSVFAHGKEILSQYTQTHYKWAIVDEVGKLELNYQTGWEPELSKWIAYHQQQPRTANLLLVVRDYLLSALQQKFGVSDAQLIPDSFFEPAPHKRIGVVLCGGQSVRMGRDKSLIAYHGLPQYAHTYNLLRMWCDEVVISCKPSQVSTYPSHYKCITDNATFSGKGPQTGLLSVHEAFPNSDIVLVGCDYPLLTSADIASLIFHPAASNRAIAYAAPDQKPEPLVAFYPQTILKRLLPHHLSGKTSLRQFLIDESAILLPAHSHIKSIDYPNSIEL